MSSRRPDLIIIRHAQPQVEPDQPAASWPLSLAGRTASASLGESIRAFGSLSVIASNEVKAIQTGEAIASGMPVTRDARFGEQGLGTVLFLSATVFREQVIAHFAHPDARILGNESSREASVRFNAAISERIGEVLDGTIPVIVAHGRIITAWLTGYARPEHGEPIAAADFWQSLRMPDAVLLRRDPGVRGRWLWKRLHEGAH